MAKDKNDKGGKGGKQDEMQIVISKPNFQTATVRIVGTAPYVQNRFGQKAIEQIMATQRAGSQAKSKKVREPKDFDALFLGAQHISEEGWNGIPAPAFRNAMISACKLVGYHMTRGKLTVFINADGVDRVDGTPLVRLIADAPEQHIGPVRNDSGVIDIRARPMWRNWAADVRLKWDGGQFSMEDVLNLMCRAGVQVGIGEGRNDSRDSNGIGWGSFDVVVDGGEMSMTTA